MRREVGREAKDRQWRVGWKGEKGRRNVKRREGEKEKEGREEGRRGIRKENKCRKDRGRWEGRRN